MIMINRMTRGQGECLNESRAYGDLSKQNHVHQDNKDTQTTDCLLAPAEVLHQHLIQDVQSRNPTPLLWTIALPVHQIREAPAPASDQDYEEK